MYIYIYIYIYTSNTNILVVYDIYHMCICKYTRINDTINYNVYV